VKMLRFFGSRGGLRLNLEIFLVGVTSGGSRLFLEAL
jgi:hypothetical protein